VRRGSLEVCTTTRLIGWAIEDDQPGVLEVFVGDERIAGIRCDRLRPDLAGIGARTDAGFELVFSQPIAAFKPVRVCFTDGTPLENAPSMPTRYESSVDICSTARVFGWAVCDGQPAEVEVLVNGRPVGHVQCSLPRPDLTVYGLPLETGFAFSFPQPPKSTDEVAIRFLDGTSLANSPANPSGREGLVDVCTTARVSGWAVFDGRPADLDILVGEAWIARVRCNWPRPDLAWQGLPEGCGFNFLFGRPLAASDTVSVRYADGAELENAFHVPSRYESRIDRCTTARIEGWALCDGQPAELDILINGELRGHARCERPRRDLAEKGLPFYAGFSFVFPRPRTPQDEIAVRFPDGTEVAGSPCQPTG
jgi:hypothetical protein